MTVLIGTRSDITLPDRLSDSLQRVPDGNKLLAYITLVADIEESAHHGWIADLLEVVDRSVKRVAAGHVGQVIDESPSQIDDVNLDVRFPSLLADIASAVSAVIVLTVRNQQERLPGIAAGLDLGESQIDTVIQRREALCRFEKQLAQLPDVLREI